MNILEASRNLIRFFSENDVFTFKTDLTKVTTISLDEKLDLDIILLALEDLVEAGIVKPVKRYPVEVYPYAYVLTKPLAEYSQTVELSFPVVEALTNTINSFCDELKLEKGRVNPLKITEEDIANLIQIVGLLRNENNE